MPAAPPSPEYSEVPPLRVNGGRPLRRGGGVEVELLVGGEAAGRPVVGEVAAVAVAEVLEHDFADVAVAGRHLEQIDELLRGQAARQRHGGSGHGREGTEAAVAC